MLKTLQKSWKQVEKNWSWENVGESWGKKGKVEEKIIKFCKK